MVAIEPVNMLPEAQERLKTYADEVRMYTDVPKSRRTAELHLKTD